MDRSLQHIAGVVIIRPRRMNPIVNLSQLAEPKSFRSLVMGKATKIILFGVVGMVAGIAALQNLGNDLEGEFAAQNSLAVTTQPTRVDPSAVAATADGAPVDAVRTGSTMLEQAIFDAFPPTRPQTKAARRNAKNAADFVGATINSAGHLCVRLIEVQEAAPGQYGVGCVKYRAGGGRANYLIDSRTGSVDEI